MPRVKNSSNNTYFILGYEVDLSCSCVDNEKPNAKKQLTLTTDEDDIYNYLETNPVTGDYMPKPLREYIPLHHRRIKENG